MKHDNTVIIKHYELLVECCRLIPDLVKIRTLSEAIHDWDSIIDSAYMHGVLPLVHKSLRSINTISESVKTELKNINFSISRRNMLMSAELIKIIELFNANSIRSIAIKGPVLSQIIHNDITQRQFTDLDILVDESQIYEAVKLLVDIGYEPEYSIEYLKNKTLLKVGKDFPVTNTANDVLIEFHWRLFLDRYIKKSNIDLFSEKNYHCVINNVSIETLELNAQLLYLLLHGSKHYWERLEWIVDIDRLVRLYADQIDWKQLITMAQEMEIEFMMYLGLAVSSELLATPLGTIILEGILSDQHVQKAKEAIIFQINNDTIKNEHSGLISFEQLNKIFLLKDSSRGWLRQYILGLFQIKELDVYMLNLPNYLAPLYYCVRLYRLFKQNVLHR
ncbi:nucleotidyltransferase family protein [Malikia sp.]|uniref:nucleotidyltransferase domain-containing protein n=1 Tax=Malikia sp. TaxID=2070706 RepID=UPI00262BDEF4|nr:nucleotidyltransferase family protein [Malikia sp.]MDD2730485.1 nucleotidyltransferase family protein [Malikia sp.]